MANDISKGKSVPKAPKGVDIEHGPSKAASMNELTSNARVVKPASSNLMSGSSQNRGKGGGK